jgi:hypothetical protein
MNTTNALVIFLFGLWIGMMVVMLVLSPMRDNLQIEHCIAAFELTKEQCTVIIKG